MPDMKRFLRSVRPSGSRRSSSDEGAANHSTDSPEAIVLHEISSFCESSNDRSQGNEFVHLPLIVETAESSPGAAKEAAHRIRKYLTTPLSTPNHIQYNAIMLMRILTDNPGPTFTRNFDTKFVTTIKEVLRYGRDWHVQHYLRQFLNHLEANRPWDEDIQPLLRMWAKEKVKGNTTYDDRWPAVSSNGDLAPSLPPHPNRPQTSNILPEPGELAARIAEAKNSAQLLLQFVESTPEGEMDDNDLIKEFVDRCRTSSRVIQTFIHSTHPAPDQETLLTLIETNDEISAAISSQQRAMHKARKSRGSSTPSSSNVNSPSPPSTSDRVASGARTGPTRATQGPGSPDPSAPLIELPSVRMSNIPSHPAPAAAPAPRVDSGRYEYNAAAFEVQNPFADDYATTDADRYRQNNTNTNTEHASHSDRAPGQPAQPAEHGR